MTDFVFVHGGGQGGWVWQDVVTALQSVRGRALDRMIALDIPGCGQKVGDGSSDFTVQQVIDDLLNDLNAFDLKNAVIIGHSQAGTIIPGLLAARPQWFSRAIFISCCAPRAGQTVVEMMGDGLHGVDADAVGWPAARDVTPPAQLAKAMFCNDMEEAQSSLFLARLGRDVWPHASSTSHRDWRYDESPHDRSYIVLEADAILPPVWQRRFAKRLGAQQIKTLASGHQPMQTQPHAVAQLIAEICVNRSA